MDVTQTAAPTAKAQPAAETETGKAKAAITSDFETFLKLLTTQISNQNPLDPMKAEEFAVQLATFSSVEQQVQTNELLTTIAGAAGDLTEMTGWIGREVQAQMPLNYEGRALDLQPPISLEGDVQQLVVRTPAGIEVDRRTIEGGGAPLSWDGIVAGGVLPHGTYEFSVESFSGQELVGTEMVAGYGRVSEVRKGPAGAILVTETGAEINAAEVGAMREASASAFPAAPDVPAKTGEALIAAAEALPLTRP